MTRNGTAYQLPPSVPPIDGTVSGLWPTPVAQDDGKTPEAHLAMKARMPGGPRKTITSLTVMVKAVERHLWPTPTASDGMGGPGISTRPDGRAESANESWWGAEPDVGRMADGISGRMDRLRALGNSVVPQIAEHIGRQILEAEDDPAR